jgi:DnaJ domain
VNQKAKDMHLQSGAHDSWSYAQDVTRERTSPPPSPSQSAKPAPKQARGATPPYVDPHDYYALLGISDKVTCAASVNGYLPIHLSVLAFQGASASLDEVRSAFRRELMKYHPDRAEAEGYDLDAASTRTRLIYDAYAVLRDPSKRAAYDASRKSSKNNFKKRC